MPDTLYPALKRYLRQGRVGGNLQLRCALQPNAHGRDNVSFFVTTNNTTLHRLLAMGKYHWASPPLGVVTPRTNLYTRPLCLVTHM